MNCRGNRLSTRENSVFKGYLKSFLKIIVDWWDYPRDGPRQQKICQSSRYGHDPSSCQSTAVLFSLIGHLSVWSDPYQSWNTFKHHKRLFKKQSVDEKRKVFRCRLFSKRRNILNIFRKIFAKIFIIPGGY